MGSIDDAAVTSIDEKISLVRSNYFPVSIDDKCGVNIGGLSILAIVGIISISATRTPKGGRVWIERVA